MKVADYIANFLAEQGVREIFMLSGTGSIYLDDAFAHQREMKYVCARHEAAAVIMAEAVAKLTGGLGVVVSTTGPGATNAAAGVVEAWVDSVPVMVISGQVSSSEISTHDRTFGIQGFDIVSHVESITKYSVTVLDPLSIRYHLERAVHSAMTGRRGPVWLDIPMNVQSSQISPDELVGFTPDASDDISFDNLDRKLDKFIKLLSSSERPSVIFGQGIRASSTISEFKNLIELLDIPAVSARMAKDIFPHSYRHYIGMGGYKGQVPPAKILKESDLILSLGTSHSVSFPVADNSKLICVNIDENILKKDDLKIDLSIHADLKDFIPLAVSRVENSNLNYSQWMRRCLKVKEENPAITGEHLYNPINSYYLLSRLDENSSERHIFVNDAGSANYVSSQTLKLNHGQREITSGAFYSMGVAVPLAIGASVTRPEAQVIVVTGEIGRAHV